MPLIESAASGVLSGMTSTIARWAYERFGNQPNSQAYIDPKYLCNTLWYGLYPDYRIDSGRLVYDRLRFRKNRIAGFSFDNNETEQLRGDVYFGTVSIKYGHLTGLWTTAPNSGIYDQGIVVLRVLKNPMAFGGWFTAYDTENRSVYVPWVLASSAEELTETYKLLHERSSMKVPRSHLEQLTQ
jgi:hypothetical protein